MKRSNHFYLLLLATFSLIFASCSKNEKGDVEFIPFLETEDGQWGMISVDGKVLFKEEFKNKPTVVRDGRFFVKNKKGIWEMYEASEKPKKIGKDYAHTSGFRNGIALVAETGKSVSIIDVQGNTIKMLDKIDGKEVDGVRPFCGEFAVFMTADSLFGVINSSGNCVIKPKYIYLSDNGYGKFIGVDAKYRKDVAKNSKGKVKVSVIDDSGNSLFEFAANKYENFGDKFMGRLLPVSVKKDGKEIWGLINDKGETVVKPDSKFKQIGTICKDRFTYYNGDGWGLMDIKGETIIRAKYESLYYDDDDNLIACVKNGDAYQYKYIDEDDQQLGNETYVKATPFSMLDGNHALVKPNDKIYSIININGNHLEKLPDMVNVSTIEGDYYIESDYIDMNKLVKGLQITQDGICGLTFKSSAKDAAAMEVKEEGTSGDDEHPAGTPYWYNYRKGINFSKRVEGVNCYINASFSGYLSQKTYRTKRVIDYTYGSWYWYHDEKIPTGYAWTNNTPSVFSLAIYDGGRMHCKLMALLKALEAKFKSFGTIVKQNDYAKVFSLNNNLGAIICIKDNSVFASWGKLGSVDDIDISGYQNITEEDNSISAYNYVNNMFSDEAVDSAVEEIDVE